MRIALNGYYGYANYGDELFNLAATLGARRWWPDHQVSVIGPPVPGVKANFYVPSWIPADLYTSTGIAGKLVRLAFFLCAMLRNDVILHAGGSTLTSGRTLRKRIERFAALRGIVRFAAIGVSVGPFSNEADQEKTAELLRRFTHLSVRDRLSLELLDSMALPFKSVLGRDLAGVIPLLLPSAKETADSPQAVLGVSLCNFGGDPGLEAKRNAALIDGVVSYAQRTNVLVRIYCLNCHPTFGDEQLSLLLLLRLQQANARVELVRAKNNLIACWHSIAACQAVISVRLHGAITAYLCGVPCALIEYHRKCTDFLEDIGQPTALRITSDCTDANFVDELLTRLFDKPPMPVMPCVEYMKDATASFTTAPWVSPPTSI
jgi:polysaccharide pyruvyl transferase WcaK-like protein